ncbi:MAG: hypothetical protein KAT78_04290, partial [Flavobacteriaceae bacterium]|nr:hypothetical protein [Flavobacteriaceae bacterium]
TSSFSQSNTEAIKIEKEILKNAKKIGDPSVASSSIYRLIALEGENSTYKDSLAYIYFSSRRYAPCFMITTEVLQRDPKHVEMLEMKGVSLESLGAFDKATEVYKQLFKISKNNFHGYTIAKLQYSIKKYDEAFKTIQEVEKLNDTGKYKVNYIINQNHNQQVELLAAIHYLKGLITIELGQKEVSILSFEKAIKIQPDFVLAKEQLESLN